MSDSASALAANTKKTANNTAAAGTTLGAFLEVQRVRVTQMLEDHVDQVRRRRPGGWEDVINDDQRVRKRALYRGR